MTVSSTFDSADWHVGGDYPNDLDPSGARTHIGVYVAWAAANGLLAGDLVRAHPDAVQAVRDGEILGSEFLRDVCDDELGSEHLSSEGLEFTAAYYEERYLDDYLEVADDELPSLYHELDTLEKQAEVSALLDRRLADWREAR